MRIPLYCNNEIVGVALSYVNDNKLDRPGLSLAILMYVTTPMTKRAIMVSHYCNINYSRKRLKVNGYWLPKVDLAFFLAILWLLGSCNKKILDNKEVVHDFIMVADMIDEFKGKL